ncbi:hypothetical protein Tco_1534959 [Tanacetum coccineum]
MSSATSAVTYTSVIVLGYDGLPIQPVAPPLPDYIPGLEDPQTPPVPQDEDEREPMFVQAHDPDYVPKPIYPEYIPLEDDHEFPAEEQPLPPVDSPTAELPGYVTESDPEEDPKEYEDDETEDGPVDYPMDGGDDGDDDGGDSSRDDASDEDEDNEDEEEEEEHLAPTDSTIVIPIDEPVFPTEGTKPEIRDVGYGIRDTWVDPAEAVPEIAPMTVGEVNTRVIELAELHKHDTQDLYALLEDAQDSRSRISQRVDMDSQRVDLLMGDGMTLQETVWMVEEEAYASREAWAQSIGLSQATHQELQTHRDHVYMQQAELTALRETDYRRQAQMVETLRVMRDMRREMGNMQTELLALRGQRRARQPAPDARILDHQDALGDANSHI